jgi:dethiobiotin synthetase
VTVPSPGGPLLGGATLRGPVLVTGTDTGVGKTVVTAAVAVAAAASGLRVFVLKLAQTGTAVGEPTDMDEVKRLAAPEATTTLVEYPEPLAPLIAAREAGMPPLDLYDAVDAVRAQAKECDLLLVEGAGGLLVPMGLRPSGEPWTVADLAVSVDATAVVVTRAGLGTLNHTGLTLEALQRRAVRAHAVFGMWPDEPEHVHWTNLRYLLPHLAGAVPEAVGGLAPGVFRRSAPGWLTPVLHGFLDDWRSWADEA